MQLPTQEQCLNYFVQYKVPNNIKQHCVKVQEVANFLAKKLHEKGTKIDLELVRTGSLLHDLFKIAAIKDIKPNCFNQQIFTKEELEIRKELQEKFPGKYENEIAYEIFKDEFPELAITIKQEGDPFNKNKNWEETLIHYADSRIFKDKVVTLEERYSYFIERYKAPSGFWEDKLADCKKQESKIFEIIDLKPETLKLEMEKESNG
jgi:5'-deoxynucleotidase YfbR-like HD superfamily hydrolase